ncbi:Hok/Gef family protein [Escherichia coli]
MKQQKAMLIALIVICLTVIVTALVTSGGFFVAR